MFRRFIPVFMLGTSIYAINACKPIAKTETEPISDKKTDGPNVVIIYADDLGYGDVGVYGAEICKTPNIDQLAKDGLQLTRFYCPNTICSPSRAGLLTGRHARRMGIDDVFFPESFTGMPVNEVTLAQQFKQAGYHTAAVGKWHLGHRDKFLPTNRGFDEYFGVPYSNDMASVVYLEGDSVARFNVNQDSTIIEYTSRAKKIISQNQKQPFFLYFAHNMPHVPVKASDRFKGFTGNGLYADAVAELDWSVGEVVKLIDSLGLAENTLIFFASDNGPWRSMREFGGSLGPLKGGKQTTFEGGVRVPGIFRWKGKIKAGTVSDQMVTGFDLFPTISKWLGVEMPKDKKFDGIDISEFLFTGTSLPDRPYYYTYRGDYQAVSFGRYKFKRAYAGHAANRWMIPVEPHPDVLFDVVSDPGETHNIIDSLPEVALKLKTMLADFEAENPHKGFVTRTPAETGHPKDTTKSK